MTERPTVSAAESRLERLAGWVANGWIVIGLTLLILLCVEVAYREQSDVRKLVDVFRGARFAAGFPYADSLWYPTYDSEYNASFGLDWKPFVYFRRPPMRGTLINVDSLGHRVTLPGPASAPDTIRVFFFGGSTLWGSYQRDSATIPSVAARRLTSMRRPGVTYDVTNFGESGYVVTQELIELELQLRSGNVPDIAVFYDGSCDVTATQQFGRAGAAENESNRAREFAMGRAIYGTETGVGSEMRAERVIGQAILARLQLFQRIASIQTGSTKPLPKSEDLAADLARTYAGSVELIEALSHTYGFKVLYVWQPTLASTTKPPTPYEARLRAEVAGSAFGRQRQEILAAIEPMLAAGVGRRVGGRFINATSLFATDSGSVFMDTEGHTTERAIPTIVERLLPTLSNFVDSTIVERRRRGRQSH